MKLRSDQSIVLRGTKSSQDYPDLLRHITCRDPETENCFVFLANNLTLNALTIAQLHKAKWRVELFFKWIKQDLHIKAFYGTSENAVKSPVCIAISVYVLVAIVKNRLAVDRSLTEILQIFSITLFEKTPIFLVLTDPTAQHHEGSDLNQLLLLDL